MRVAKTPVSLTLDATGATSAISIEYQTRFSVIVSISHTTEVQTISFSSTPDVGTWTVTYDGNTTSALQYNASSGDVQTALRLLAGLASVTVSGTVAAGFAVTMTSATHSGTATSIPAMTTTTTTLGIKERDTLTFPTTAAATHSDYFVLTDTSGNTWAIALDKTGGGAVPTGAVYTAVNAARKGQANISTDTTAAQVAARVETALNALASWSTLFTSDDTAANGTMIIDRDLRGNVAATAFYNDNDSGAGSITGVTTTQGSNTTITVTETTSGSEAPSGALTVEASNNAFDSDNVRSSSSTGVLTENTSATWSTVAGSSQTITADGTYAYNTSDAAYTAFRLKWTRTEGNGSLSGYAVIKGT